MKKNASGCMDLTAYEAIKHAEEVADRMERDANACARWTDGEGKSIAKCKKCAAEHRQLAAWLKELKAYREAFEKAKRTVKAYLMLEEFGSEYQDDIEKLIEECRPKEGDSE